MKTRALICHGAIFLGLFVHAARAQTNTFPSSGNVGIGTTSPNSKLQIVRADGKGNGASLYIEAGDGTGTIVDNTALMLNDSSSGSNGGNSLIFRQTNASSPRRYAGLWGLTNFAGNGGNLVFGTTAIDNDAMGPSERMRISASGNVGIGTTSPAYQLSVKGPYSAPQTLISSDGSNGLFFQAQGNSSHFNWLIGQQRTVSGALEFAPSAAVGSTTFTTPAMLIMAGGNVGIGTTNPTQKLSVNGAIRAKEVIVDTGWADYVFAPDYKLASLAEVETHIKENGHLPGIPSAKEVAEHGVSMGEMQAKLLAKIEELTLHIITQEKRQSEQEERISRLETENAALRLK